MWPLLVALAATIGIREVVADSACPTESYRDVVWASNTTDTFVTSEPLCLSDKGFLMTRNCSNQRWTPRPWCSYRQPSSITVECESGWMKISKQSNKTAVCARVESPKAWSNVCASYGGSSKTLFELDSVEYQNVLRLVGRYGDVWLPGKWPSQGSIRWRLPGRMNRTETVKVSQIRQNPKAGSGCVLLSAENNELFVSSVNCSENFPMLCLTLEPTQMLQLACPPGYLTSQKKHKNSWCHTVQRLSSEDFSPPPSHTFFQMWSQNVLNIPKNLLGNHPGLLPAFNPTYDPNLSHFYRRSDFESIYTYRGFVNWRRDVNFNVDSSKFLVCDQNGRWLFSSQVSSAIWSTELKLRMPSLSLTVMTGSLITLQLNVQDSRYVWKLGENDEGVFCFRKEDAKEFRVDVKRVTQVHVTNSENVTFTLQNLQPGLYQCQAYAIRGMKLVKTNEVFIGHDDEFVSTIETNNSWKLVLKSLENVDAPLRLSQIIMISSNRSQYYSVFKFRSTALHTSAHKLNTKDRISTKIRLLNEMLSKISVSYSVSSSQLCLSMVTQHCNETVQWPKTLNGTTKTSNSTNLALLGTCRRDETDGIATWDIATQPACNSSVPELSTVLLGINSNFLENHTTNTDAIDAVYNQISNQSSSFDTFQLLMLRNIMHKASKRRNSTKDTISKSFKIFDRILDHSATIDRQSPSLSVTNDLLTSFEETVIQNSDMQTHTDNYRVITLNPRADNFSGVGLLSSDEVKFFKKDQSSNEICLIPELLVAAFIPEGTLDLMPRLNKVVFIIINNDHLYQQSPVENPLVMDSKIISVHIPNVETSSLPGPISVFHKHDPDHFLPGSARSWSMGENNSWTDQGIKRVKTRSLIEQFNASFAGSFAVFITEKENPQQQYLHLISKVGCSLSLVGILFIFLTAICFPKWAKKPCNVSLLQLSFAIGALMCRFLFFMSSIKDTFVCTVLGTSLHYNVLVIFFWMLTMSYLQLVRYIIDPRSVYTMTFTLKISAICWLLPAIPVAITYYVSPDSYGRVTAAGWRTCYATGGALIYGVTLPVAITVTINLAIYIRIIVRWTQIQHHSRSLLLTQLKVSVLLFFLLGLPWLFGLLIRWEETVCPYLFCVFGSLQGFVLFVIYILLNQETQSLWKKAFGCRHATRGAKTPSEHTQTMNLTHCPMRGGEMKTWQMFLKESVSKQN